MKLFRVVRDLKIYDTYMKQNASGYDLFMTAELRTKLTAEY